VDETFYAADLAEVEERTALLMEAGSEGVVTIMRTYIEELTQAQICCVAASFRPVMQEEAAAQLLASRRPRTCRRLAGCGAGRASAQGDDHRRQADGDGGALG
jgi:hypothetical protein